MNIYDRFAKYYDTALAPFEHRFISRWREESLGLLPVDSAILEIGAGTGANFRFYPKNRIAISSDPSHEMLLHASRKANTNLLLQANAMLLPFSDNFFDAAFATLVFCTVPEPLAAFAELRRVIAPGGMLILLEHVRPAGPAGYFFDLLNIFTAALIGDHFNRETARLAGLAGFDLVEVRKKAGGIINLIICRNPA